MRAYQLKISDRNSPSPLWWRCVVPAGVTFSQLSVILDLVTNHLDGDTFHFIFFHKARVWEPTEENPLEADFQNEAADAASVCIGAYLEDEKTFSYKKKTLYLKLSVERRLGDYALDYPLLSKCSDELRQPELRAMLERRVAILAGEPCRRTRRELLDVADGARIRMVCAEDTTPPENAIERSGQEMTRDLAALLSGSQAERFLVPGKYDRSAFSYRALLNEYPVRDLRDIAKLYNLPEGRYKKKEPLIDTLIPVLLEPSTFARALYLLSDDDMRAFRDALERDVPYEIPPWQENHFDRLSCMGYVFVTPGETPTVTIPDELRRLSASLLTDALEETRRRVQWVMACLNEIVPPYYAILPLKKFCRLCRRTGDPVLESEAVPGLLDLIPERYRGCVVTGTEIYAKELDEEQSLYEFIVNAHQGKPCYIMRQSEIAELLEYGYPVNETSYRRVRRFLVERAGITAEKADGFNARVCACFANGYGFSAISELLTEFRINLRKSQIMELLPLIQDAANHTPTFLNRGYTPEAMRRATTR